MDGRRILSIVLAAGLGLGAAPPMGGSTRAEPILPGGASVVGGDMSHTPGTAAELDTLVVVMETTLGTIVLELYPSKAPVTVENFVQYVEKGFYTGLVFHRVIPGFVIQGGGLTKSLHKRSTLPPIVNESDNGLANERGTIAMAREADPNSARSQFYINLSDNSSLDFKGPSAGGWGYTVFGRVREGMDVADAISRVETGVVGGMSDVPLETIMIRKMTLMED